MRVCRKVRLHVHVEPTVMERLRRVSAQRGVSTGDLLREGVDRVLELAETQDRCIEKARRSVPVTDPETDAPDGAVVDGYERSGDTWNKL